MTRTVRFGLYSIGVGVAVLATKFAAWWITGSVALYSDALESIINVVAACTATLALWVGSRPADQGHPYGHGKAEYLSAVLEGVLIILAALSIMREALGGFLNPQPLDASFLGMAVSAAATAANGVWGAVLVRSGRTARSPALVASGKHLFTDVFTSAGVLLGFALVPLTGWLWLDPALAAVVALNILWSGTGLVRESVGGLMDAAPNRETLARLRGILSSSAEGAIEVHELRVRHVGHTTFLECHLVLPGDMPLRQAHAISDRMEEALRAEIEGAVVTIHMEPEEEAQQRGVPVI
ncbi:cation diffusion facilitator family transporter [Roseomonas populi]|uniref:Cation diffusion facilitator family transporter n=1 Tax=Roseomonas populi TaxID=3121582 RepID=A0ABT1X3X2_9PROT|nr:cation diffusion facilitator family transporter [Roseomonas pecuniae]MCR0982800.1 cation diffusion facilitator family transporter [Roseomonas pecuniae]